jgi:hypothetical protein
MEHHTDVTPGEVTTDPRSPGDRRAHRARGSQPRVARVRGCRPRPPPRAAARSSRPG